MPRPTIRDLAEAARVSVSTVNRVLAGDAHVRPVTMTRVRDAAQSIGFYGLGSIHSRVEAARRKYRIGFLLLQPHRVWYKMLAQALTAAAEQAVGCEVDAHIEFLDDLAPQHVAAKMLALAEEREAIGLVAAVHAFVTQAIETLHQRGVPVFALISQLASTGQVSYVGLDNWKVGRTSAWAIAHICKAPGKIGILIGNHRYRCQEMNESGFRSYFREYAPDFTLLEPRSTFESSTVAQEMTERLIADHGDLAGLYVAGGGITGALSALRGSGRAGKIVVVGYELMNSTREALLDGTLTVVISHPLASLASEAIAGMTAAINDKGESRNRTRVLPFEIYTKENI
jgi:LacI family transcriptional regulator